MRTKCNFISSMIALFALPYTQEIEGSLGVNFTYILVYNAAFFVRNLRGQFFSYFGSF